MGNWPEIYSPGDKFNKIYTYISILLKQTCQFLRILYIYARKVKIYFSSYNPLVVVLA